MKINLNYPEISTIHNALNIYLDIIKKQCDAANKPELYKESVAYELYFKFREMIEEYEQNEKN